MVKRQVGRRTALAGLLLLCACSTGLATTILDFEEWTGGYTFGYTFSSRGFVFTSSALMVVTPDASDGSRNGTATLRTPRATDIVLARADGLPFDLLALDCGEGNLEAPSTQVILVGYRVDGNLVSTTVALDGLLPGFQTARIDRFEDVIRVSLHGDSPTGFSMDNIIVPEPASICPLLLGVALFSGLRRYRRQSPQ